MGDKSSKHPASIAGHVGDLYELKWGDGSDVDVYKSEANVYEIQVISSGFRIEVHFTKKDCC